MSVDTRIYSLISLSSHAHTNSHTLTHRLHITGNGNVELVFEYDSDWSDLADDEDPDSNDERFEGNDYPDEGAGEEGFS